MQQIARRIMASINRNLNNSRTARKANLSQPPRSKSTNAKPNQPMTRTLMSSSTSAMDRAQADTTLLDTMRNLSLRNKQRPVRSAKLARIPVRCSSSAGGKVQSLEDIVHYMAVNKVKNVVVMAGAGISTASGIPDFRTPGTGLYDNLQQYKIPYPEAIFSIDYFHHNPRPFFTLARELYPSGQYRPNAVHYFCRLLSDRGMLLRMYTQNIDGLERIAGIPPSKMVEAHGTFSTATCVECRRKYNGDEIKHEILTGKLPLCRNTSSCGGIIKPDIVFFGEDLPRRFWYYLKDFPQADMLIVMGTSLEVEPFAGLVDYVRFPVPRILFNLHAVGPFKKRRRMNDHAIEGDLVENIELFISALGWQNQFTDVYAPETKTAGDNSQINDDTTKANENEKIKKDESVGNDMKKNESVGNDMKKNESVGNEIKRDGSVGNELKHVAVTKSSSQTSPIKNGTTLNGTNSRALHTTSARGPRMLTKRASTGSVQTTAVRSNACAAASRQKFTLPQLTPSQRVNAYKSTLNQLTYWRNPAESSESSDETSESTEDSSSDSN